MSNDTNISPSDKINWKITLQEHIDRCLHVRGIDLEGFEKEVDDLRSCLYYDLEGLRFREEIKKAEDQLIVWYDAKLKAFQEERYRPYYDPIKYQTRTRPWRFQKANALFEFLTGLIAEHGGLLGSQKGVEHWREGE